MTANKTQPHNQEFMQAVLRSVRRHKKSNLLTEFSNLIFTNFILKHVGIELTFKYINLQGFFYVKLSICPPDVKRPKCFRDFTP